jgi:hypothetical protein
MSDKIDRLIKRLHERNPDVDPEEQGRAFAEFVSDSPELQREVLMEYFKLVVPIAEKVAAGVQLTTEEASIWSKEKEFWTRPRYF